MIPELKELTYKERLENLNLPTLAYRRIRGDMIETFKILNNHYDKNVSNFLCMHRDQVQNPDQIRGHSKKLFKRRPRLDIRKHSFGFRIVDPWNSLPEKVVTAPSTKAFERRLDKFWANQDIKFDFKNCIKILHKNKTPLIEIGTGSESSDHEDLAIEV